MRSRSGKTLKKKTLKFRNSWCSFQSSKLKQDDFTSFHRRDLSSFVSHLTSSSGAWQSNKFTTWYRHKSQVLLKHISVCVFYLKNIMFWSAVQGHFSTNRQSLNWKWKVWWFMCGSAEGCVQKVTPDSRKLPRTPKRFGKLCFKWSF